MPNLLITDLGNMVVFEGEGRVSWTRSGSGWRFDGIWPSVNERRELHSRIAAGASLLVVLPLKESPIPALGSEVGVDQEMVEIQVPPLDWLSHNARRRGLNYRESVIKHLVDTPPLLRAGVMVNPGTSTVRFAVKISRHAETHDHAFAELADHLFAQPRRRWSDLFRKHVYPELEQVVHV